MAKISAFPKMFLHHWLLIWVTIYPVTYSKSFEVTGPGKVITREGKNTSLSCEASDMFNQCSFSHNDKKCTFILDNNKLMDLKFEAVNVTCPELNAKFVGNFNYILGKTFKYQCFKTASYNEIYLLFFR